MEGLWLLVCVNVQSANKVEETARVAREKEEARRGRIERKRARLRSVWELCQARGIRLGKAHYGGGDSSQQAEALPSLDSVSECDARPLQRALPDGFSDKTLHDVLLGGQQETCRAVWPLLFLYPQYLRTDFVERAAEDDMLALLLAEMLPEEGPSPPWDASQEYSCSRVEVYFQVWLGCLSVLYPTG